MKILLTVLFASKKALLSSPFLPELGAIAERSRNFLASLCVAFFLLSTLAVLFYRAITFEFALFLLIVCFPGFLLSAMLASRFGRLCNAESDPEYVSNIQFMCSSSPECLTYYNNVRQSGRAFTKLDLYQLSIIHRQSSHADSVLDR